MSPRTRIILIVACAAIALVFYLGYQAYRVYDYEFFEPKILTLESPSGAGWVHLVWEGIMMGRELHLLVSHSEAGEDARWIGCIDSDAIRGRDLYWSKDGMAVFASCDLPFMNFSPQEEKAVKLTHAYDFSQRQRYAPKLRGQWDPEPADSIARSEILGKLAEQHGGLVHVNKDCMVFSKTRDMSWSEWRTWRERLRVARERETRQQ